MLSENEIKEIRAHLDKAQNPVFFFDNDVDGLCSFLIFRRAIGRGKGIAIKSFPDLDSGYARKIKELDADYVFILDKPLVSQAFFKDASEFNVPIVWIDHHDVLLPEIDREIVNYYNTMRSTSPSSEPVTYWSYKIAGRKEDLWLAVAGSIGDGYLPDFARDAEKKYPELWRKVLTAFEGVYETELGKLSRVLSFSLKDRTSNVVRMMKFMFNAKPEDVLVEDKKNALLSRFNQINSKYEKLVDKAKLSAGRGRLLYFQYGGELSISAEIANEIIYRFPEKIVVVAYLKGTKANLSLRGKEVRSITLKALEGIEGARGGGHRDATGCQMNVEDLPRFKESVEKLLKG